MRILREYLLREILGLFALSLLIVTVLFMSQRIIQLTDWAVNRGVGMADMTRLLFYLLPSVLSIIIPIVTLFSILLAVGRLSSDNEITALKSSGISLYRLFPPALSFAAFTCALALFLTEVLIPAAATASRELRFKIVRTRTESAASVRTFLGFESQTTLYIREKAPDGELRGLMAVIEYLPGRTRGKHRISMFAERGRFVNDPVRLTNELWLREGVLVQENREDDREDFISFDSMRLRLELMKAKKDENAEERAELGLFAMASAIREAAEDPKKGLQKRELRELRIQWHERFAFPLGCLALCFWALPLGIQPPRAGRARAIVVSILLSGTFYYLMILAKFAALQKTLDPAVALWLPDAVITLTGIYMLRQKNRERPVLLLSQAEDWIWYTIDQFKTRRAAQRRAP